jgi:membrane associated rhomboid family serine protease
MTETVPQEHAGLPTQPPALARLLALLLVTRHRLRLCDPRDSRLGELASTLDLALAGWTGPRAALVGFFRPPADPAAQVADLHRRVGAALRWGDSRLTVQPAQRSDILLVALGRLDAQLPPTAHPAVAVGVVWADPETGEAGSLLPPPPSLPGTREVRAALRALRGGAQAPTLAAVDLAERETVRGGYVAPARRALTATPWLTYSLIAALVVIFVVENTVLQRYGDAGYLGMGGIDFSVPQGSDWWRLLTTALLHAPGGTFGFVSGSGATSYFSLHLIMNCISAWILGRIIEPMYGRLALLGTFIATAMLGDLVSTGAAVLHLPGSSFETIGASGGLMGLLGLLLVIGRVQGKDVPAGLARALRQGVLICVVLTAFLGFSLSGLVNNYAHAGGLISGALIGLGIPPVRAVGGSDLNLWQKGALLAVIAVGALAVLLGIVNLVQFLANPPPPGAPGV